MDFLPWISFHGFLSTAFLPWRSFRATPNLGSDAYFFITASMPGMLGIRMEMILFMSFTTTNAANTMIKN